MTAAAATEGTTCTRAAPWRQGLPVLVSHPDAHVECRYPFGDEIVYVLWHCPCCGQTWLDIEKEPA